VGRSVHRRSPTSEVSGAYAASAGVRILRVIISILLQQRSTRRPASIRTPGRAALCASRQAVAANRPVRERQPSYWKRANPQTPLGL